MHSIDAKCVMGKTIHFCFRGLVLLGAAVAALLINAAYAVEGEGVEKGSAYTFPVKSINLDAAPGVKSYTGSSDNAVDAHPVFGMTMSKGFLLCGKGMESETSENMDAFAVLLDKQGNRLWKWSSKKIGNDACNAAVELPNGDILIAGFRTYSGVAKRSITKLDKVTGAEKWTVAFDDKKNSHGALEMLKISNDGATLFAAGLYKKPNLSEFLFKSYGNCPGGQAIVTALRVSDFSNAAPPSSLASAMLWTKTFGSGYMTAKDVVEMPSKKNVAVLLWSEDDDKTMSISLIAVSGGSAKFTKSYPNSHMEPTSITATVDETSSKEMIAIGGHGGITPQGEKVGISGRLALVDGATGDLAFIKSYSSGGTPKLIFNECWGIAAVGRGANAGFVMSCGTGIEGCQGFSGTMLKNCKAGKGDLRPGAYKFPPGLWQSMTVRTDLDGKLLWQRVDAYRSPESPPLGAAGWEPESSAGEWVFVDDEDTIVIVQDEGFGVGLMILEAENQDEATKAPTAQATTRPTTDKATKTPTRPPTNREETKVPTSSPTTSLRKTTKSPTIAEKMTESPTFKNAAAHADARVSLLLFSSISAAALMMSLFPM